MREGSLRPASRWPTCLLGKPWIVPLDRWKRVGREFLLRATCAPARLNVAPLPWVKAEWRPKEFIKCLRPTVIPSLLFKIPAFQPRAMQACTAGSPYAILVRTPHGPAGFAKPARAPTCREPPPGASSSHLCDCDCHGLCAALCMTHPGRSQLGDS